MTIALLGLLMGCGGGGLGDCMCIWEGPVTFERADVWSDSDGVYLTGDVWTEPCCGGGDRWAVQVAVRDDASVAEISAVPAAAQLISDTGEVTVDLGDASLVIWSRASDSIIVEQLQIGELLNASGGVQGEVWLNVQ